MGADNISSFPSVFLSNKNPCKDVIHIGANAEEYYYHIELMCNGDNGIEYGIQAYGEEAKELCKEINWFTMAATSPSRYAHKEVEGSVKNDYIISRRAAGRTGEVKVSEESN